ncbi:hypothetical protein E2C01_063168 [Portunus trituberculatus]|uniref:Uncharacterized protein n=1 Tax=Portunus trituberculatus TaxID=210409 RepID=A0A5B7HHD8_PORTR|nr:hypothetical protein [Portunus trituberculatus]
MGGKIMLRQRREPFKTRVYEQRVWRAVRVTSERRTEGSRAVLPLCV